MIRGRVSGIESGIVEEAMNRFKDRREWIIHIKKKYGGYQNANIRVFRFDRLGDREHIVHQYLYAKV